MNFDFSFPVRSAATATLHPLEEASDSSEAGTKTVAVSSSEIDVFVEGDDDDDDDLVIIS